MYTPPSDASWARDAVFYHVYPLGFCGAPPRNDFTARPAERLTRLYGWIDHLRWLGVNALYLGPVFEATAHGYDTADYFRVDRRLGTGALLAGVVAAMHEAGVRVLLDGVFHHVGRDFWAFRDLREKGEGSAYRGWFSGVDFGRRSPYGDPFAYDGWNGHYDLVKLDLRYPDARAHLFDAVRAWFDAYGIDGLRLDVAGELDPGFLHDLSAFVRQICPGAWLLGEAIHGDYRRWAGPGMLDAVTNYEAYKGLYSSHNDHNYFEIAHSLDRQFGAGGCYGSLPLYAFADNHDVDRVASVLRDPAHLYPLYLLLFTMPGVPSVYAGSEWGLGGVRRPGDDSPLRPSLASPESVARAAPHPDLAAAIARFAALRHRLPALRRGAYRTLHVAAGQLVFERRLAEDQVVVAVNAAREPAPLDVAAGAPDGTVYVDLLEPGPTFPVRRGRLGGAGLPSCWGRVLVPA